MQPTTTMYCTLRDGSLTGLSHFSFLRISIYHFVFNMRMPFPLFAQLYPVLEFLDFCGFHCTGSGRKEVLTALEAFSQCSGP